MKRLVGFIMVLTLALGGLLPALGEGEARYVRISVENYGDIYAALYPETAPITVENFLRLVNEKFYDGLTFHRIISGFMIQGGDPLGNGTGGSGTQIKGEFSSNGVDNPLKHARGVLSMARSAQADSASSQFFIMHQDASHLDGNYAAFGQVLSGLWIVDKICQATPVQDQNGTVLKEDQPVIASIREVEKAEAEKAAAAEAANGLSGTVYRDPLSDVFFPVPAGWNRVSDEAAATTFVYGEEVTRALFFIRYNQWDSLPAAYKQQFAQQGKSRKDLDTSAFRKEGLIGLTGQSADAFQEAQHSGVTFHTAEISGESGAVNYFVGARNGYVYLFVFSGSQADPLYANVLSLLDHLTFAE